MTTRPDSDPQTDVYIHGSDPTEQARLSLLNDLLNDASLADLAIRPGERVLDVGSGLGQMALRMAAAAGAEGKVVGVERDPAQLARALELLEASGAPVQPDLRSGEAPQFPLADDEWATFDVAHARFVLEHVRRPIEVVRGMLRAVRPGGRIVLEDDEHDLMTLWPEPPGFMTVWRAYAATFTAIGNDPAIGRKLSAVLVAAGAEPVRTTAHFFGGAAGSPVFPLVVENMAGVIDGAAASIAEHTALTRDDVAAATAELRRWGELPDASLWYLTLWAEGRRPE